MGYETWQDFADAVGDRETVADFAGDVVITAYNVRTGLSYGNVDYLSDYPSYCFTADGELTEGYYGEFMTQFHWNMINMDMTSVLNDYISFSLNRDKIITGETYSFGIMVTSESAEAIIEVNIEITEYIDPEVGQYDNPSTPGTYNFNLNTEIEVPEWNSENWFLNIGAASVVHDIDVGDKIKETLGMTSLEIYKAREEFESYFVLSDESRYRTNYANLDADGMWIDSSSPSAVQVTWYYTEFDPSYNELQISVQMNWPSSGSPDGWGTEVIEALENNKEICYKYVIEYKEYELVFNHTIKFKWAESAE